MRPTSLVLTDDEIANFGKGGYPDWGRVRDTLQHLQSKWEFEHALANDQQAEIERLDEEVIRLQDEVRWLMNYGRIPQLETLLREAREELVKQNDGERFESLAQILAWEAGVDAALGAFTLKAERTSGHEGLTRQPSYAPPPADPLLAKPERHR